MKLLIITNLFPNPAEPGKGLFNQQQFLALAKHCELKVIAPVPWFPTLRLLRGPARWAKFSEVPPVETVDGIEVHHPRYLMIPVIGRVVADRWFAAGIRGTVDELCRRFQPDRVLATWAYPDIAGVVRLRDVFRAPLVAKLHGSDINLATGRRRRQAIAAALRRCERVICVSSALKEKTAALGIPPERIEVIPNGIDTTRFTAQEKTACRRRLGLPVDRRLILFVGNLVAVKGADVLPEIAWRCRERSGSDRPLFAVVGDGALRAQVAGELQARGLQESVRLAGARPHEEIPTWLGACDVLCVPSRHEGCPNIVLEALASGRPVVGSDTGGIGELVRPGTNGLLVPAGDLAAMTEALVTALRTSWDEQRIRSSATAGWGENAKQMMRALAFAGSARRGRTVLHVLSYSVPNASGYTHRSQCIIEQQRILGAQPVVLTSTRHAASVDCEEIRGIRYYRSRFGNGLLERFLRRLPAGEDLALMVRLWRDILRVARAESATVIHAHSPVLCGLPALLAARRLRVPFVYEVRALWEDAAVDQEKTTDRSLRYHLTRRLESYVLRRAGHVVVICEGLRQDIIRRGIAPERLSVMPNGVDVNTFTPLRQKDPVLLERYALNGHKVVGFIGSFFQFEGLRTLLDAVPLMRSRDPSITVMLVGSGEQEEALKRFAEEQRLDPAVIFTGRVPHDLVQAYYSIMDVLVYPRISKRITELVTPLKPLEAMALGRPVVASDVGGLRELVEDRKTGLLFRSGDSQDLAEKCLLAAHDAQLSVRLVEAGRAFVERERQWSAVCRGYLDLYERLEDAA